MIVDIMRSAYVTDMQFDVAGDVVAPIRWYRAPAGAKIFPVAPAFHSSNYGDYGVPGQQPGELPNAKRSWSNGATPKWSKGNGVFCGSLDWWQTAVPSSAPPLTYIGDQPQCCGLPGTPGKIGVAVGLSSCVQCPAYPLVTPFLTVAPYVSNLPPTNPPGSPWEWQIVPVQFVVQFFLVTNPCNPGSPPWCLRAVDNGSGHSDQMVFAGRLPGNPRSLIFLGPDYVDRTITRTFIFEWFQDQVSAELGVQHGLRAFGYTSHHTGQLGIKFGLVANAVHATGQIGVKHGLSAGEMGSELGRIGAKHGLVGQLVVELAAQLGAKHGLVGAVRSKLTGAVGAKFGLVSSTRAGIIVPCCPGLVIANSLTVTRSGHTATATYIAADNGWHFNDPLVSVGFTLQCLFVGGVWQFQCPITALHCVTASTQTAKSCSHPFTCTVQAVVSSSGGTCLVPGTYTFSFSE